MSDAAFVPVDSLCAQLDGLAELFKRGAWKPSDAERDKLLSSMDALGNALGGAT